MDFDLSVGLSHRDFTLFVCCVQLEMVQDLSHWSSAYSEKTSEGSARFELARVKKRSVIAG